MAKIAFPGNCYFLSIYYHSKCIIIFLLEPADECTDVTIINITYLKLIMQALACLERFFLQSSWFYSFSIVFLASVFL